MRVRYTETALRELEEIFSYLRNQNPKAAAAVVARIEQVVAWIGDFPQMGYLIEDNIRLLPVGRYPFLIFYTADENDVIIRNVRHAARRRPGEPGR
jgi:toxin ParE1/3/4